MRRRDLLMIVGVAVISAIISLLLASLIFKSKDLSTKVPVVDKINTSFPDVQHDPDYNSFLNSHALDLTQPVQIGNSQNQTPFNNSP